VVAHQPFEEGLISPFRSASTANRCAELGQQLLHLGLHRLEIGHRHAHFTEHLLQLFAQHVQFGGVGAAVDLQVHQRLLQHAFALGAFGRISSSSPLLPRRTLSTVVCRVWML
jgi:hypothetical protein